MSNNKQNTTEQGETALTISRPAQAVTLKEYVSPGEKFPTVCTIQGNTQEEKVRIFNAVTNCENSINDLVNLEVNLTGFYVSEVTADEKDDNGDIVVNELTGEVSQQTFPRTILFTDDGNAYAGGSIGVYNALNNLVSVFGYPKQWTDGKIRIKVSKIQKGKDRSITTFKVVG